MNDLPELDNNWANALAKSYKDPEENKLLRKTGDMGSFITWFCKRIGKKKLSKSNLEGPSFKAIGWYLMIWSIWWQGTKGRGKVGTIILSQLKHVEDLQLGIESYKKKLNLTQPDWDASKFLFNEDYTIVIKPRAVIYRDKNDQKKMMRETEVHKFNDGTLNRILDKLDHMVKDFKLYEYNKGMET
ncbi:hypothetical protein Tco_1224472 [Tanacetum coccineum]